MTQYIETFLIEIEITFLRSFQRGTLSLCGSKGWEVTSFQSWNIEKEFSQQTAIP